MRIKILPVVAAGLALVSMHARGAGFDGSKPMLCALMEQTECAPHGECIRGSVKDIGLPTFVTLDVANQRLVEKSDREDVRSTPVDSRRIIDGKLIVQGGEFGRAWGVVINIESGDMSAAITGDGVVFAVFGSCTHL